MKQSLLRAPRSLEICDVPMLEPGAGELIVAVDLALTCGTDLKTFRRGHPKFPCPTPLGHEFTGTIARVGRGLGGRFREGDPVLTVPSAPCMRCDACQRGLFSLCEGLTGSNMAWGAFADCVRIPAHVAARNVFPRPPGLDLSHAALLEPLSCVVNGVEAMDLARRETIVVLGAGPIGLLFAALLKERGVPRVVVVGKRALRLAAAKTMGADVVIDLDQTPDCEAALREIAPRGACAVVECVGRPEVWEQAVDLVRKGGEVLFYGGCPGGSRVSLDTRRLHYEALTLKGAFHFGPSDVRVALDLILRRALPLECLISGEYSLMDLALAFDELEAGRAIKLAIRPEAEGAA